MKRILVSFALLAGITFCHGQKILTVDFDRIRQQIADSSSPCFYPVLKEKFIRGDTSLSTKALQCLYYGASLTGDHTSTAALGGNAAFQKQLQAGQYREAVSLGQAMLRDDPVNIRVSYGMFVCYGKLGIEDSARLYAVRYYGLLSAIAASGDGLSEETAMVVTSVPDEYDMIREAGYRPAGQSLLSGKWGHTDKMALQQDGQEEPKIPALYFNVEMSFIRMRELLEGKLTLPSAPEPQK